MAQQQSQIIHAPSLEPRRHPKSIFLAGSTSTTSTTTDPTDSNTDWRVTLTASLAHKPITIYNPHRPDWDHTWRQDVHFPPFRSQVEWELDKQEAADIVVVYLHPATQAAISLLEMALSARVPGKVIVCCPEGYWKSGNVRVVCLRYGVEVVDRVEGLVEAVLGRLEAD